MMPPFHRGRIFAQRRGRYCGDALVYKEERSGFAAAKPRVWFICTSIILAACTNGGTAVPVSGGSAAQSVDVNLSLDPPAQTSAGTAGGYAPTVTTVRVGTTIRFVNSDGFAHTATLIGAGGTFPAGSPFSSAAQTQSGNVLSANWSTGTLGAGTSSQTLLVDRAGTYLYGCFFHYGAPMRAIIVAQ